MRWPTCLSRSEPFNAHVIALPIRAFAASAVLVGVVPVVPVVPGVVAAPGALAIPMSNRALASRYPPSAPFVRQPTTMRSPARGRSGLVVVDGACAAAAVHVNAAARQKPIACFMNNASWKVERGYPRLMADLVGDVLHRVADLATALAER